MSGHNNYERFKVAAVQAGPILKDEPPWFDLESTLDKTIGFIDEAGSMGAKLIVFPECHLPCYPHWSLDLTKDFYGFTELWANFLQSSLEVPSPETEALREAAKRANSYVVIGINERDKLYKGRMYNSILYLSPGGDIIGTHRKICNTAQERLFHTPGDGGDNLKTVFATEIGKLGGSICGEHTQLMLLQNWILQGIQVHCSLWPGIAGLETITDLHARNMCIIAHAYGVLAASYIPQEDWPKNFYENSRFSVPGAFRGGSGIVNPDGEYIAGPVYDQEAIVYGDIDLSNIDKTRWAADLTGIFSRWDLFSLNVQQKTYEPVVLIESEREALSAESNRLKDLKTQVKQLEQQISAFTPEAAQHVSEKQHG